MEMVICAGPDDEEILQRRVRPARKVERDLTIHTRVREPDERIAGKAADIVRTGTGAADRIVGERRGDAELAVQIIGVDRAVAELVLVVWRRRDIEPEE